MNKLALIKYINKKTGIEKQDVALVIKTFIQTVQDSTASGLSIDIRGFGSFFAKKRAAKIARNLMTNTAIQLDEYFCPCFKPSKKFTKKVKENLSNK